MNCVEMEGGDCECEWRGVREEGEVRSLTHAPLLPAWPCEPPLTTQLRNH